jgi:hypothetical protein
VASHKSKLQARHAALYARVLNGLAVRSARAAGGLVSPPASPAQGFAAPPSIVSALLAPALLAPERTADAATTASMSTTTTTRRTDDNSDLAVNGPTARSATGMTGAGIRIGILSDSFNMRGGMAAAIAAGDLPSNVQILAEGPSGSHDEGQAMAELIHRIAPDAQLYFHTATASESDFAAGIAALVKVGCTVIVDDVVYLDEPFFQDTGAVDAAVQAAIAAGVTYITAAGNEGTNDVESAFAPMRLTLPGLPAGALVQNFGTAAAPRPWLDVSVPSGGVAMLDLQWPQPYGGSADSLGLALYDASGNVVASATLDQTGGNPDQILSWRNTTTATSFRLVLYANGGAAPPSEFKIVAFGNATLTDAGVGVGSGSVIGHAMLPDVNTVGAIAYAASPAFGGSDTVESYSSAGGGAFLVGTDGTLLSSPLTAGSVDFLAPDGSLTDALAPFYGTSAAAANAAGVAALVQEADPWLTPMQLTSVLEQSALPVGGAAATVGAGLIQADTAVQIALGLVRGTAV